MAFLPDLKPERKLKGGDVKAKKNFKREERVLMKRLCKREERVLMRRLWCMFLGGFVLKPRTLGDRTLGDRTL